MNYLHLEHDLFLLLLNLSQITDEKRTKDLFLDSMNSFSENLHLIYIEKPNEAIGELIEIATSQNSFGFIDLQSMPDYIDKTIKALVRNSVRMLALFLEKQLQDKLLSDEKMLLNNLVAKQTQSLEASNKEMRQEIAARKKAEDSLREANTRHSAMIANIGDVIGIMGADGIMQYKSSNIEKWFGWKPEDLIGTDAWETVYPEDIERVQKEFYALLEKDNASTTVEYRYKCKYGTYKWIELTAVNCINDTTINGILLNYHDISDRKQAENDLRKSEEKFRATFRTSPDAINLNRAEDGLYIDINDGFTKIMGYSREDIIGKSSLEFNIWNDSKDREKLVSGLKKNGLVENLEVKFISKDGQIKTGLMSARILSIENENTILSITRDITEKKQIEDQLKRSEERYRKYFEEDLSGSYISTPEGQLIACNKEYLKIFGFKNTQEALKTPISKIFETFGERAVFLQTIAKEKKLSTRNQNSRN